MSYYIAPTEPGMPTPVGLCNAPESIRNVLALQRCSGCHAIESDTNFVHISNRTRATGSHLSKFLVGNNPQPTLQQLYYGKEADVLYVSVPYLTYIDSASTPGTCDQPVQRSAQRKYHDLARRALFLAAVLAAPATPTPNPLALLTEFRTNFPD